MASNNLRLLDLFSGIGGFSYAAEHLVGGFQTVAFVEREPFCQSILHKHWPSVPIHDDITTFRPESGSADVVCGGFPCQDISTAGKQAGIKEGTRSGLFFELMRVVRLVGPQYIVLENVSAILANGLDTVLGELAEAGFDAEWACIPASAVGACHQRDRWWLVAYANDAKRREISPERCSKERPERVQGRQEIPSGSAESHATSDAAYPQSQQRHDSGSAYSAEPIRASAQPGNGDGADVAHTGSANQQRRAEGAGRRQCSPADAGSSWLPKGGRCADATADPNSQRQQEQHTPTVSDQPRWPCWGHAPQRLNPDWHSYLSQPVLRRGDDGLSGRVDRLKALGNAVVPQVAAIPLCRVLQLHREAQRLRGF